MAGHLRVECPEPVEGPPKWRPQAKGIRRLILSRIQPFFGFGPIMPEHFRTIPIPAAVTGRAFVYLVQSADGSLYIGQTVNVAERLRKHRCGRGSKFTSDHASPRLVFCEGPLPPDAAVSREAQLKRWSRAKKEALIRGDRSALRQLSRSREEA